MFQSTHSLTAAAPVGLGSVRFLIVDSESEMRSIYRTILKNLGAGAVDEAADSVNAVNLVCAANPDVVILEHQVTPCSGIEVAKFIRSSPTSPNPFIPILMVAANATLKKVEQARDAGVTEFLAKPLTARNFCSRVGAVLANTRPFVRTKTFFGPDRRRHHDDELVGRDRRVCLPPLAKVPSKYAVMAGELLLMDAA